ncbi:MAG: MBL fold metallo-hydrolase [Bacteroidetes bacterium]|nr:MBL fold metallo-hydrolase [Bacteroidota bacterium]
MITIKTFVFNPFQVNTYILYDETKKCIIIDPACMDKFEENELSEFIEKHNLQPLKIYNTHTHLDHVAGNRFVAEKYLINLEIHKNSHYLLHSAITDAQRFGLDLIESVEPSAFISDGDIIKFGSSELEVLYTPGHADGSVCFYSKNDEFVISGDVLFNESIGRSDLPTGNHKLLVDSIKSKLLVLPEKTVVYPGHGPVTTIGYEKENNPFLT